MWRFFTVLYFNWFVTNCTFLWLQRYNYNCETSFVWFHTLFQCFQTTINYHSYFFWNNVSWWSTLTLYVVAVSRWYLRCHSSSSHHVFGGRWRQGLLPAGGLRERLAFPTLQGLGLSSALLSLLAANCSMWAYSPEPNPLRCHLPERSAKKGFL